MQPPFVMLDFPAARADTGRHTRLFRDPLLVLEAATLDQVEPVLRAADAALYKAKAAGRNRVMMCALKSTRNPAANAV